MYACKRACTCLHAPVLQQGKHSACMQGLWYSAETKIERGFYCCYDPFARVDVRCELCIPGGVVCGALDANGTVHEVTPEIWRNCQLASFLRYELYDADLTSHANTLRR